MPGQILNPTFSEARKHSKINPPAIYPERLVVYHAGATRSAVLGCLKVTTIVIFTFFSIIVVPHHWHAEDQPKWVAVAVLISGIVPMVFVSYIASPFVAHIHLRLPSYARYSHDVLKRYTRALPVDAKLELTTMNTMGVPRITPVKISELRPVRERFGMVNYVAERKVVGGKKKWYLASMKQFGIHGAERNHGKGREDVWTDIVGTIERRRK